MIIKKYDKETFNKTFNGMIKRGFNQTASDIVDSINLSKKQMMEYKKENNPEYKDIETKDKIENLKKIERNKGGIL